MQPNNAFSETRMNAAIIGGGAAGFFLAIHLKQASPQTEVTIYEKSKRPLAKVTLSGGGRCNLTNSFRDVTDLKQVYPRGAKLLKRLFNGFDHHSAYQWFEQHGVRLVTQEDACVFPQSQDAQSVVLCLTREAQRLGVVLKTNHTLEALTPDTDAQGNSCFTLRFKEDTAHRVTAHRVAVTTGGSPHREGLHYLEQLGHPLVEPVPSLFTFNIPDPALRQLMGTVVEETQTALAGTPFRSHGPLLVTHWGMSGPAILKLSSHAARHLAEQNYRSTLLVNWVNETHCEQVTACLEELAQIHAQKQLASCRPYDLPARLWTHLLEKTGIAPAKRWGETGRKTINKLVNTLTNDSYTIEGRGVFRDEFVTCGGISLKAVDARTLESKVCPGLFFAGEVLDIDAVTGGFNFQAAWTTAYTAATAMAR